MTDALANLTQLASKYVAVRDLRAALDGEPQSKRRMFLNSLQNPANLYDKNYEDLTQIVHLREQAYIK